MGDGGSGCLSPVKRASRCPPLRRRPLSLHFDHAVVDGVAVTEPIQGVREVTLRGSLKE